MRMWSSTYRFNEGWNALSPEDRVKARAMISPVALRVDQVERDTIGYQKPIKTVLLDRVPDLRMVTDPSTETNMFRDDRGFEVLVGAALALEPINEVPVQPTAETPDQFFLRLWDSLDHHQRVRASECMFTFDHVTLLQTLRGGVEIYGDDNIHLHEIATDAGVFLRDAIGNFAVDRTRDAVVRLLADSPYPYQQPINDFEGVSAQAMPQEANDLGHEFPGVTVHPASLRTKALYIETIDALASALASHNHVWSPTERGLYDETFRRLRPQVMTAYEAIYREPPHD